MAAAETNLFRAAPASNLRMLLGAGLVVFWSLINIFASSGHVWSGLGMRFQSSLPQLAKADKRRPNPLVLPIEVYRAVARAEPA